ncbi:MAG TPA: DUF2071 domain-containing protein [Planctomycetota bacterium]|nr:DUF2071 domain-containing protein [Planctomycetota bacterium]
MKTPFFHCAWRDPVFLHYEVDPGTLRIPFPLDLHRGKAYVSVVAITIRTLARQAFLNVRTYVKGGIHFLAGWLPNPLCALLGPRLVGIPYRLGRLTLDREVTELHGSASAQAGRFEYRASIDPRQAYRRAAPGSLDDFLLERYVAFTRSGLRRLSFRTWHAPWSFVDIEPRVEEDGLLRASGPWYRGARLVGGHHAPGFDAVGMGRLEEVRR